MDTLTIVVVWFVLTVIGWFDLFNLDGSIGRKRCFGPSRAGKEK